MVLQVWKVDGMAKVMYEEVSWEEVEGFGPEYRPSMLKYYAHTILNPSYLRKYLGKHPYLKVPCPKMPGSPSQ